ncbi:hypothetical protein F7018_14595 [Tenacibaculum aiptasiae]|uniref:Methyltransferase type 11 n=1 Tax=Tenacibaculum aiptasiae TaxID=426481 RepID=A0A7J5A9G4_9FLAO|nr:hypothetical protein [Tenacibaculum aiptasiae]KAB1154202.1 hypothetical protein F7018_14595 [Tenacibaculum aiptasiae]
MVLVFKTDIKQKHENEIRKILFDFTEITKIDFDFEDCDNILRIEADKNLISEIETLLNSNSFYCKDLV